MIDGDGLVVHEVALARPPAEVFAFLVDAERLVRWIGISADLQPVPGGRFRFEIVPGQYCDGAYLEIDPPRRVVFSWGWTDPAWNLPPASSRVEVDLAARNDGGTLLRLVHRDLPGDLRPIHDEGWTMFLTRLDAVVAGRPVPEHPTGGGPP